MTAPVEWQHRGSALRVPLPCGCAVIAVRWYLRYGLSYRDVEELLAEHGITADHVSVYEDACCLRRTFAETATDAVVAGEARATPATYVVSDRLPVRVRPPAAGLRARFGQHHVVPLPSRG